MILYRAFESLVESCIKFSGRWVPKNRLWAEGRVGIIEKMRAAIGKDEKIFWVHAASVGEFEQGRPIIEYVREHHPEYKILLTFFSPSGYELRKNYKGADHVFYFPSDRKAMVREFLDAAHPEIAIIIKYEFWLNTLAELRKRQIRTFLVSACFQRPSIFFVPWGYDWRKALKTFETIFVQNEHSCKLLENIGISNVIVAGDTRFDRVFQITRTAKEIEVVQKFCAGKRVFVAGSTWGPDEQLLVRLCNDNPEIKFIIAPHEMNESRIASLMASCKGGATRYTKLCEDFAGKQVLVIDTVGLLSTIYKYASWAYVGGGFGVGIHNTVEPASFGIPIAFGPKYKRFDEAKAMVRLGIAQPIRDYKELADWFKPLKEDEKFRSSIAEQAMEYTRSQLGATQTIMKAIGL